MLQSGLLTFSCWWPLNTTLVNMYFCLQNIQKQLPSNRVLYMTFSDWQRQSLLTTTFKLAAWLWFTTRYPLILIHQKSEAVKEFSIVLPFWDLLSNMHFFFFTISFFSTRESKLWPKRTSLYWWLWTSGLGCRPDDTRQPRPSEALPSVLDFIGKLLPAVITSCSPLTSCHVCLKIKTYI